MNGSTTRTNKAMNEEILLKITKQETVENYDHSHSEGT